MLTRGSETDCKNVMLMSGLRCIPIIGLSLDKPYHRLDWSAFSNLPLPSPRYGQANRIAPMVGTAAGIGSNKSRLVIDPGPFVAQHATTISSRISSAMLVRESRTSSAK
jgi:hypothetical protein